MDQIKHKGAMLGSIPLLLFVHGCSLSVDRELIRQRAESLYGEHYAARLATPQPPAPEEQELLREADLQRYLAFGLRNNAGLKAAFERFRAAVEKVAQASSLPDPVLSFTEFIEEIQTRTGPQERRFGLRQTLPFFGKQRLLGEIANNKADALWQQVVNKRLLVEEEIADAYHEYSYLGESLRITQQNLELLKQLEPVVQRRIQVGGGQSDLLKLQVEIGKVENDVASLKERRPALNARLAAALNYRGGEMLPLPKLVAPQVPELNAKGFVDRALQNNPRLLALDEQIAEAQKAQELAGLLRWPDVTVGVDYFQTGSAIAPGTPDSGDDPVSVSISLNLPIWGGRYAAAEREARSTLWAATHERQDLVVRLRAQVELLAYELSDAGRQIALYGKTLLPRSREALQVTRAAYRAGTQSLLDVIDSERALLAFETSYWRACRDYLQGEARMKTAVGGELR
jgi:cobalt-zinc-cadmium efflux system outer membrane protein